MELGAVRSLDTSLGSFDKVSVPTTLSRSLILHEDDASPASPPDVPKRFGDVLLASFCLLLLIPIILFVAALILFLDGRPVFFKHRRVGKDGRVFGCLKFRTMHVDSEKILQAILERDVLAQKEWQETRKLRRDPRITKIGGVLRRSSIDELPQLLNILSGEMSFVGPRPIVRDEVPLYGAGIADYYKVRPGLTGLWQVSGRSDVSFERRVRLDCEYVRSRTLIGDFLILIKTIPAVFVSRGCY